MTSAVILTDHEIREEDPDNIYFKRHLQGSNYTYFDGQYTEKNYVSGFGHGRVEVIASVAAKMGLENLSIGHHDPTRTDQAIDKMLDTANKVYDEKLNEHNKKKTERGNIFGSMDRMMIFIPDKRKNRKGVVVGRMNISMGNKINDFIGEQNTLGQSYDKYDLTRPHHSEDQTE